MKNGTPSRHVKSPLAEFDSSTRTLKHVCLFGLLAIAIGGCSEQTPAPTSNGTSEDRSRDSEAQEGLGEPVSVKRRQADAEINHDIVLEELPISGQSDKPWQGPQLCAFGNEGTLVIRLSDKAVKAVTLIVAAPPIPEGASILEKAELSTFIEIDGNVFDLFHGYLMKAGTDLVWKHPGIEELSEAIDSSQPDRAVVEAAIATFAEKYGR